MNHSKQDILYKTPNNLSKSYDYNCKYSIDHQNQIFKQSPSKEQEDGKDLFYQSSKKAFLKLTTPSKNEIILEEYNSEIYSYLKEVELTNIPNYNQLFKNQQEINANLRQDLIYFLTFIHFKLKLEEETLFLSINFLDNYTERAKMNPAEYKLAGITCLFIASKFDETNPPSIEDFVIILELEDAREYYTVGIILEKEYQILATLNFDLLCTTPYNFLNYYFNGIKDNDKKVFHLANYIMQICLLDIEILKFRPSVIASSALYMSRKIIMKNGNQYWNDKIISFTGYTELYIKKCVKTIVLFLQKILSSKENLIKLKFETEKFEAVGNVFCVKQI